MGTYHLWGAPQFKPPHTLNLFSFDKDLLSPIFMSEDDITLDHREYTHKIKIEHAPNGTGWIRKSSIWRAQCLMMSKKMGKEEEFLKKTNSQPLSSIHFYYRKRLIMMIGKESHLGEYRRHNMRRASSIKKNLYIVYVSLSGINRVCWIW